MKAFFCSKLIVHAGAVIMLGMLSGIPLAMTLIEASQGSPADWTLSHMEGLINGLLMLAIAASGHLLVLSQGQQKTLFWSLLITGYSNALYGWVRGFSGQAGMDFAPPVSNQLAALLGGIPIFTAFTAVILLMIGAYKASLAKEC